MASEWTLLGRFMNSPGWSTQVMTVYEARGLTEGERDPGGAGRRQRDDPLARARSDS